MLYDDRDLRAFDNSDEREAFREVLQTYYSRNYRASIVSLYSLVMFDLYNKLQYMAEEGEDKAKKELSKVNKLIEEDEKYSLVEKELLVFFEDSYSIHFNRFSRDLAYLKDTRDDCAHLKVNSTFLSIPKDYQVRMLISSMYENLFTVKAPFMDDLFSFVSNDIEQYSSDDTPILQTKIDDVVRQKYEKKYFSRMTQTSLLRSLRTLMRLLFVSDDEDAIKNSRGLYIVLRCLIQYIDDAGLGAICAQDDKLQDLVGRIEIEGLQANSIREDALFIILCTSRWFCDEFRKNGLFQTIVDKYLVLGNVFERYFSWIFPDRVEARWQYYIDNVDRFPCEYQQSRLDYLKDAPGFSDVVFIEHESSKVPSWTGYDDADAFMSFFSSNIESFSNEAIEKVISSYNSNNQFHSRRCGQAEIKLLIDESNRREMQIDWSRYYIFSTYIRKHSEEENKSERF